MIRADKLINNVAFMVFTIHSKLDIFLGSPVQLSPYTFHDGFIYAFIRNIYRICTRHLQHTFHEKWTELITEFTGTNNAYMGITQMKCVCSFDIACP